MNNKFVLSVALLLSVSFIVVTSGCSKDSSRGRLGIEVPIGDGKVGENTPYIITGVYENSTAYKAGLRPGDIIVQINNEKLDRLKYDYIYNHLLVGTVDTKVTIVVDRGGKEYIYNVARGR